MYDELVKNLRVAGDFVSLSGYQRDLMREAADAIEELSRAVSVWAKRAMVWAAEAEKAEKAHRWIPVTERLPEKECKVLAYYGFNRGDGHLGMMFMQVMDYYTDDPRPHFQHEGTNGLTVTHWMLLPPAPEPPKEEGK